MTQEIQAFQRLQAAHNNAVWCDTMCRAHGVPGEFVEGLWFNRHQTPPFYPNAVTLTPTTDQQIDERLATALPAQGAVKDSFCTLDLTGQGYTQLFTAQWLWRDPTLPKPQSPSGTGHWTVLTAAQALSTWENAWNGPPTVEAPINSPHLFLPALLADPQIRFLAAYQSQQIVAGAIASVSGTVVGLSNLFYPARAAHSYWAGCVATIMELYPTLPIVGYERDHDLEVAQTLGFTAIGPLRIWARA